MVDFILIILVLAIFLAGVQVGAWFGGIPQWIRWVADKAEAAIGNKPKP